LQHGRAAEAVAVVREWLKLYPEDPTRLVPAARNLAEAAGMPDTDGRRKEYVRMAVDALRAAVANGFRDAGRIDREFAPLRSDPEFQRLMTELRRSR
jgi:hypothetical protein